jgi:diguanylate cyclase
LSDGRLGPEQSSARASASATEPGLELVFGRSATGMCIVDARGRVERVNDAVCRLLKRDACELQDEQWSSFTYAEDRAAEAAALEAVKRDGSSCELEKRVQRANGELVWCRQTVTPLQTSDANGRLLLVEVHDASAEHALAERHRAAEERIELAIAAAQDAFVGINARGTITAWNQAAEAMFGWSADEAVGRQLVSTIVPEDQREAHERGLARYVATGEGTVLGRRVEVDALRRNGSEVRVELTIWPVAGEEGVEFNAFLRDVSERQRFQEELRQLAIAATTDQGTGLKNRRGFFALAEHELNVAQRLRHPLTLIFFDLDRLKSINDTFGHLEGDRAIADTATILRSTFRESDLVARLGGDEFCVLALGPQEGFKQTMRRFEGALEAHNLASEAPFALSLSYGVAFFNPEQPASLDELMSDADTSMYESKMQRRSA